MTLLRVWLVRSLSFLGSVRFTTILLVGGALVMIVGTILESREGRDLAWSAIYGTRWFDLFLLLIAVNLVVAVVNRLPIRRQQWPFAITHLAIVLLLAGAWISRTYGYEGQLIIPEGGAASEIVLNAPEILIRWKPAQPGDEALQTSVPITTGRQMAGRVLQEEGPGQPGVRLGKFLEGGAISLMLAKGDGDDAPGVQLDVQSGTLHAHELLIAGDASHGRKDLGPLQIEFLAEGGSPAETDAPGESQPAVLITRSDGQPPLRIPVPSSLGREVALDGDLRVTVRQVLLRAHLVGGTLTELPDGAVNPAAVVELRAGDRREVHTVFSRFPEMAVARRAEAQRPLVASVAFDAIGLRTKPLVSLKRSADGRLRAEVSNTTHTTPAVPVEPGRPVALGSTGIQLEVTRLLEHARTRVGVQPAAPGDAGDAFAKLEATLGDETIAIWVPKGSSTQWTPTAGGTLELAFRPRIRSLPFAVALDEFQLLTHPGSSRAAEYRSHIRLESAASAVSPRDAVISMNRPLDFNGFRLFQSSYRLGAPGKPDITILTVSYDPGVPLVYAAFLLLVLGIAWGLRPPRPRLQRPEVQASEACSAALEQPARVRKAGTGMRTTAMLLALLLPAGAALEARAAERDSTRLPVEETRDWAILADGRLKPLQTFANETAIAITGRARHDDLSALEFLWGYLLGSRDFADRPYFRVDSREIKTLLKVDPNTRRLPFNLLYNSSKLRETIEAAVERERRGQKLSRLDKDALDVYAKLERVAGLISNEAFTVVPVLTDEGGWSTPQSLSSASDPKQQALYQGFVRLGRAYSDSDASAFEREARSLGRALRELDPDLAPSAAAIERELFYVDSNAFGKAWKLYLASFLVIALLGFRGHAWGYAAGFALIVAGFVCHSIGVGTRWLIAGRAPVSDMYESLVFMGWGAIFLGLLVEAFYRNRFPVLAASVVGFLCLAFSENLPLDASINPLVPVLAHTSWLAIHVMTVMLAYAGLGVAMALGHGVLFLEMFRTNRRDLTSELSTVLHKTIQVGMLFLAAGIIFGAVWANESWGRYWGWDPKETWSLITFFVYLAIIHARLAGWLRPFGLAVCSILGFLAVVMTYYGVNFILATGLHAYGFSEGGQLYVGLYAAVEVAIVLAAWLRRNAIRRTALAGRGSTPIATAESESAS